MNQEIIRGILHAIYFKLNAAFLKNQRELATKYLSMLQYELNINPHCLETELTAPHIERFNKIREKIKSGEFGHIYSSSYSASINFNDNNQKVVKSGDEIEFCKKLIENKKQFLEKLGINDCERIGREIEFGDYGRADFIAECGRQRTVIECKMGQAKEAVISQVQKYITYLELKMCYGLWDKINPIVLAEDFTDYVKSELSRMGVKMFFHKGTIDSISEVRIKESLLAN